MTLEPWIDHDKRRDTFVVRWRDASGKKCHDKGHIWRNRRDANKRMAFLKEQQRNNAFGVYAEMTLNEVRPLFERLHLPTLQNDASRDTYRNHLNFLCGRWGNRLLTQITYNDVVECWQEMLREGYKKSTPMKYLMLLHCIYERFRFWNEMVPDTIPEKIALPQINPVKLAKEFMGKTVISTRGHNRKRRVSDEELRNARAWCVKNDPELWEAIKLAIWTALRKSDLKELQSGGTVDLIQKKTGKEQIMPIELRKVPTFGNLRTRWDYLRGAMGWLKKDTPLHTTWHDLRHCAPSMLADGGFSPEIIAQYIGDTEKQARKYTHPSGSALIPAVGFIKSRLEAL